MDGSVADLSKYRLEKSKEDLKTSKMDFYCYCSLIGQLFLTREKQGNKYSLLSSAHPKLLPPSIASWSDCSEKKLKR